MQDWNTLGLLAVAGLILGYLLHVSVWPYHRCPRCRGYGHQTHPLNRRAARPCHACDGSGIRPRLAYRLWRAHRDREENQR